MTRPTGTGLVDSGAFTLDGFCVVVVVDFATADLLDPALAGSGLTELVFDDGLFSFACTPSPFWSFVVLDAAAAAPVDGSAGAGNSNGLLELALETAVPLALGWATALSAVRCCC